MCTALAYVKNSLFFGRNMDIEYRFGEKVVITPREYSFDLKKEDTYKNRYAIIGMANVTDDYPLYAEACNEKGLCMAGLNFPFNAKYAKEKNAYRFALAPYEIIPFVLGSCADLNEAEKALENTDIVGIDFKSTMPCAPLHWIIADQGGSIVVEYGEEGMKIYDNPYGVITNNPPFPYHTENVRQYMNLKAEYPEEGFCKSAKLTSFGVGGGAVGLAGDWTSPSRFVRAVFCKENSLAYSGAKESIDCVSEVFHILDSVAMPAGSVLTKDGKVDKTTYSCCIDAAQGAYYYKTYSNSRLNKVAMNDENKSGKTLCVFPLNEKQDIMKIE